MMNDIFTYPFDSAYLLKKAKSIRKEFKNDGIKRIPVRIAILSGSTANAIAQQTELFLLDYGIEPEFYLSEYGQYWQDAMFPPEELISFKPDLIYIYTTNRNISAYPSLSDNADEISLLLMNEYERYERMWKSLKQRFACPIIQNNFELPPFRLLGNSDCSDIHGRVRYINMLNMKFSEYAEREQKFYINDINYLSACYGLDKWADGTAWHMYKYALSVDAIPTLAANTSAIIKAIYGKNKKAIVLDLDNTLWGGVVGDDGVEGIKIGMDLPSGQVYSEFQEYLKLHKDLGVLLTVCSKNDCENAVAGLMHPQGTLRPDDFTVIKANWENKDRNITETAEELSLLSESFVFADDNPAERQIVKEQLKGIAVPPMDGAENYIRILDRNRYFEVVALSEDDKRRGEMYKANAERASLQKSFSDYGEYLDSLQMAAEISPFIPAYIQRIAQLTNKSNQFNVTTRRYTEAEIEAVSESDLHISLYGKLMDKFGDNGVVSVIIGHKDGDALHMDLWIMSCRVLKREMEFAMLDEVVKAAQTAGLKKIIGYYYPTAKNSMVKELYGTFGFTKVSDDNGNTVWELDIKEYQPHTKHILINGKEN